HLPEQLGTVTNAPFLQAFNSGGMFLGQTVYPGVGTCDPTVANSCPYKTLTFTRPSADIAFVAFSSFHAGGPTIFGEFDNLSFPGPTAVPEPSSLFLLGTGLTALGSHVWRRHRITGREPGDRRANREEARVPTGHWMPANREHL